MDPSTAHHSDEAFFQFTCLVVLHSQNQLWTSLFLYADHSLHLCKSISTFLIVSRGCSVLIFISLNHKSDLFHLIPTLSSYSVLPSTMPQLLSEQQHYFPHVAVGVVQRTAVAVGAAQLHHMTWCWRSVAGPSSTMLHAHLIHPPGK